MTSGTPLRSTTPPARPAIPRASSITTAARICSRWRTSSPAAWPSIRSICGRCRCFTATAGASRGRLSVVAGTHVCLRAVRAAPIFDAIATHKVTHLCGAPIVMSTLLNAPEQETKAPAPRGGVRHRRGAAAGIGAGGDEGRGLQRHPCLRADRNLRAGERQRLASRVGRLPGPEQAAKKARQGVRYPVLEALDVLDPETMAAGAARRRDAGRSDVPRQRGDEGLSEKPGVDRSRPSPAAGFIPAISASSTPTATSSSRIAPRTSSSPAARTFPRSKSRTRCTNTRRCKWSPWSPSPTRNGARRPAPSWS